MHKLSLLKSKPRQIELNLVEAGGSKDFIGQGQEIYERVYPVDG